MPRFDCGGRSTGPTSLPTSVSSPSPLPLLPDTPSQPNCIDESIKPTSTSPCPGPVTNCVGSGAALSALHGRMVRWIPPSAVVHIPLDSRFCEVEGTEVRKIEGGILRSGSEWGKTAGRSARVRSMGFNSLLALLCARRCFQGIQRRSRSPMLSLDRVDGGAITDRWPRGIRSISWHH